MKERGCKISFNLPPWFWQGTQALDWAGISYVLTCPENKLLLSRWGVVLPVVGLHLHLENLSASLLPHGSFFILIPGRIWEDDAL